MRPLFVMFTGRERNTSLARAYVLRWSWMSLNIPVCTRDSGTI